MHDYFQRMVNHIAQLSKTPGWGAYTREWAKELEADRSGAYTGLVEAVRSQIASSSVAPKSGG